MLNRRHIGIKDAFRTFKLAMGTMLLIITCFITENNLSAQELVLDSKMHHLRNGREVEWAELSTPLMKEFKLSFQLLGKEEYQTLKIRQNDIKQRWQVKLNGHILGGLDRDENDKVIFLDVPVGILLPGENQLLVEQTDTISDDILVGQIVLLEEEKSNILSEASVQIDIYDGDQGHLLPARITVTNKEGTLQPIGDFSGDDLAIRTGFLYTGSGKANFGLPAGNYTMYATRGFEYGVDSISLHLAPGDHFSGKFQIKREVPTEGWISSDTHIHTYTHSGHGDAIDVERVFKDYLLICII